MKIRAEHFGAIIALDDPPALVHVDRDFVRSLGQPSSPRWEGPDPGHLSAPTEVHLMTTNRCPAGCPGCYTAATPEGAEESTEAVKAALDRLADMGVFHVALGGGESLMRDDLFELAAHARARGLVPNLTTSGIGMNRAAAVQCRVFGQVNVSLDGLGETYRLARGYDGAAVALRALALLAEAGVPTGINYVVQRCNWDAMAATVEAAAERGANEVEFLRFKPAGRGFDGYLHRRLLPEQADALLPRLLELSRRWPDVHMKVDCSFVPFLCAGDPDPAVLERFGVIGCEAGNVLAAVKADLQATPCSFVEASLGDVATLANEWDTHPDLGAWRSFVDRAPEPCASCPYQRICRGGCKVVSRRLTGELFVPDPECPRVRRLAAQRGDVSCSPSTSAHGSDPSA